MLGLPIEGLDVVSNSTKLILSNKSRRKIDKTKDIERPRGPRGPRGGTKKYNKRKKMKKARTRARTRARARTRNKRI
jgi:hypothetical protein